MFVCLENELTSFSFVQTKMAQNNNQKKSNPVAFGVLFSTLASGCMYFAWQARNKMNAIKNAPSFKV
jgi:hypothetical protein